MIIWWSAGYTSSHTIHNGLGMLHHIVFDDILNYIVIVLKYEL
jgi:hypothetical protein